MATAQGATFVLTAPRPMRAQVFGLAAPVDQGFDRTHPLGENCWLSPPLLKQDARGDHLTFEDWLLTVVSWKGVCLYEN